MHQTALSPARSPRTRVTSLLAAAVAASMTVALALMPLARTAAAQDAPVQVVASFSVLADLVENVGGDGVEVTSLVPIGGDAHTFDPSPDQVAALSDADLIVQVGGEFEPWLADMVESSATDATVLSLFAEDPQADDHADEAGTPHDDDEHAEDEHTEEAGTPHADDEHADEDGHEDHGHGDLHGWMNVHTTLHAVENIAAALSEISPDASDTFAANADAYITELDELEAYIIAQTDTIPEDQRLLVTTHQTMDAFADAYGFEIAGVLLESDSTEGDAPASHVAELTGIIEKRGIPAVFADTPGGEGTMQPLADEAGVEVAPALYIDTLGEEGSGAESYLDMMRHNIDTIVAALGA